MKYLRYEFSPTTSFVDALAICDKLVDKELIVDYGNLVLNLEQGRYETLLSVQEQTENNILRLGSVIGVIEMNQTSTIRKFNESRRNQS